jgi:hypothetical protein
METKFLDQMGDYQFLKDDSAATSQFVSCLSLATEHLKLYFLSRILPSVM